MRAMILAAGLGTRLRPLTHDRPKALVEVAGQTLLEITLARLREFGVGHVILNVHHFADMMAEYLKKNANFGMKIEISREDTLLDTGGGLKKAAWFFVKDSADRGDPFILHNVDVISTIDFNRMLQFHNQHQALATLAVKQRETSRYLLFDEHFRLSGRLSGVSQQAEFIRPSQQLQLQALAFSGIHVISPRMLSMLTEDGAFSIIDSYVRLAGQGENILGFRADQYYWRDLGKPESVLQAEKDFKNKVL